MTETATISGGNQVTLSLSDAQVQAARAALTSLSSNYKESKVLSSGGVPTSGLLNAYNIDATPWATYTLPSGGQTIVVYNTDSQAQASVTIDEAVGGSNQVVIGNNGNDTINALGASGTIIAGDGNNTIDLTNSSQSISAGTGKNTIKAVGNDTITLGSGADTVTSTGSATVIGGSGTLVFDARNLGGVAGINSTVYAGSGAETMFGGSGTTKFYGSTTGGSDYMVGGTGANVFEGGNGTDVMVAGSGVKSTSVFEFASSVSGGTHTIDGFVIGSSDTLELQGYKTTDIQSIKTVNGSTVIKLDDHTTITLTGVTNFNSSDIKFTS
jgi:Ca2+-binding RTX toxin-like protein